MTRYTAEELSSWAGHLSDVRVPIVIDGKEVMTKPDIDLTAALEQGAAALRVIEKLRTWMAEYPADKYTGEWWVKELDRLETEEDLR